MSTRLLSPPEAFQRIGVGNTKGFALLKEGHLRSVKIGKLRRIPEDAVSEYISHLEAQPHPQDAA